LGINEKLITYTTFQTIQKSTFLLSLNQNSCPVLDAEDIKKQEQKEAIARLYP